MKTISTKTLSLCSFYLVILIISAKISIPLGVIPLTLQTFSVFLCAYLLTPSQCFLCIGVYLLMGLLGLPVFASGGGLAYIIQPSFGFLLSFVVVTPLLSAISRIYELNFGLKLFCLSLLALAIIYLIGSSYMLFVFHTVMEVEKSISQILSLAVIPFLFNDTLSLFLAMLISRRLIKYKQ